MLRRKKHQQSRQYEQRDRQKQPIFSYRSSRKGVDRTLDRGQQSEVREAGLSTQTTKTKVISRLQVAFFAALLALGVFYSASLTSEPEINVEGKQSFPREENAYLNVIKEQLSNNLFNKNKLTLNRAEIITVLREKFPEIQYVEVKTSPLRPEPVVNIQLAQPTVRLVTPKGSYVLDGEGRALFDANQKSSELDLSSLIPLHDNSGHNIEIGKPAVTTEQIAYIREVMGQFEAKSIGIKEMTLASGGVELQVRPDDVNYFIKFSFYSDPRQSSGAYIALREDGIAARQYIDVRIPDRGFVK